MRPIAAALLASLAACPAGPDAELARAVHAYDEALVRAYAAADASGMAAVATAEEANRVQILIDLKTAGRLVLESRLEAFEVTRAVADGDAGTVETRERWWYRDRRLAPGAPPAPEIVAEMAMRYALVRQGGLWRVASVSTVANTYLQGPGATAPAPGGPALR